MVEGDTTLLQRMLLPGERQSVSPGPSGRGREVERLVTASSREGWRAGLFNPGRRWGEIERRGTHRV